MTRFADAKFSVGGAASPAFDEAFDRTFGEREDPGACTVCKGRGRDEDNVDCLACMATGRKAWQKPTLDDV